MSLTVNVNLMFAQNLFTSFGCGAARVTADENIVRLPVFRIPQFKSQRQARNDSGTIQFSLAVTIFHID